MDLTQKTSDGRKIAQIVLPKIFYLYQQRTKRAKAKIAKGDKAKEIYLLEKKMFGIFAEQKALAELYAKKQTEYNTRLQEIRVKKEKLYEPVKIPPYHSYDMYLSKCVKEKTIYQVEMIMNNVNVLENPSSIEELIKLTLKKLNKDDK